jgi:hypothetical protein
MTPEVPLNDPLYLLELDFAFSDLAFENVHFLLFLDSALLGADQVAKFLSLFHIQTVCLSGFELGSDLVNLFLGINEVLFVLYLLWSTYLVADLMSCG